MPVTGLVPPIVTPFYGGRLDMESLQRVVAYVGSVVSGFLVGGSVGEHPSLSLDERIALIRAVARYKRPEHTLVAGVADNSIEHSIRLAEAAEEAGADLLIASSPNYYAATVPMVSRARLIGISPFGIVSPWDGAARGLVYCRGPVAAIPCSRGRRRRTSP